MEGLFGQLGAATLLHSYWPHSHFVVHGPPGRLPEVLRHPLLRSLDALASVYRRPVAFGRGRVDTRTLNAEVNAAQLHELGFSVYLSDIAALVPGGRAWVASLEQALGVTPGCSKMGAFASPTGEGLPRHFDGEDVISVQLAGSKVFEVARVKELPYPVGRQFGPGMVADEELYPQALDGFPNPDGVEFERIRMEPGSVLFLPRGTWHETHAESDSFSISVGIRQPPALELLLHQLRQLLLQDPVWRRPLYGPDAVAHWTSALRELPNIVSQLQAPEGELRFQKIPTSGVRFDEVGARLQLTVTALDWEWIERTTLTAEVPGYLREPIDWLAATEAAFTETQLRGRFGKVPADDLKQLLDLLSKAGFLRPLRFPVLNR